jgi:hypothetical protein
MYQVLTKMLPTHSLTHSLLLVENHIGHTKKKKNLVSFRGPTRKLICLQKKCGIHMVLRDSFELLANKNSTKLKMCYGITQGKTNNTFIMRRHPIGPVTVRIP